MIVVMPRWDPQAEDRLRDAAVELYLKHGYENVTVAQITERAGLTRRTFSRYFTDKRDVLFAGSERLPVSLADAVLRADAALPPFGALLAALVDTSELLADRITHAAQRRAIINASPELQERERTKFAVVTTALAEALKQRGTADSEARLLAQVGVAIFQTAFGRWTDQADQAGFPACIRAAATELARSLGAVDIPAFQAGPETRPPSTSSTRRSPITEMPGRGSRS
jgi:AcrR family transcriptional regulator